MPACWPARFPSACGADGFSLRVVSLSMLLWGVLIAVLIAVGMATDFIAMAAFFPGWATPVGTPAANWPSGFNSRINNGLRVW